MQNQKTQKHKQKHSEQQKNDSLDADKWEPPLLEMKLSCGVDERGRRWCCAEDRIHAVGDKVTLKTPVDSDKPNYEFGYIAGMVKPSLYLRFFFFLGDWEGFNYGGGYGWWPENRVVTKEPGGDQRTRLRASYAYGWLTRSRSFFFFLLLSQK